MKHVVIGTAGHVGHGKTELVKALTGIDTDRLEEEKRRGVTIELGFAHVDYEDGMRIGVVDVPGHEKFIRNMLAGAGGIDLALLVIAADEGVMPQTREHLGILTQLSIGDGLVAVTKLDKAEPDWLELVIEDVTQLVKGTFLEGKPILPVSARSGEGLPELKLALREMADAVGERDESLPFRLPVDRVFPIDGFGIVVTGTLIEGKVCVSDSAQILPSGVKTVVRNIQIHDENAAVAYAGQRTAISLAGVKRGDIRRGDVVTAEGTLKVTDVLNVRLNILSDSRRTIQTGSELHMYHGTRTILAKVHLFGGKELRSGESCYAQLRLREPLPCKRGDRFIVRFYSPLETIGGGLILDTSPQKRALKAQSAINALNTREHGSTEDIADLVAYEFDSVFSEKDMRGRADMDEKNCSAAINALVKDGRIIQLLPDRYISAGTLKKFREKCMSLLENYHRMNPLRPEMNLAELRQKLTPDADVTDSSAILFALRDNGHIVVSENGASLPDFSVRLTPGQSRIQAKLSEIFSVYDTPAPGELALMFEKSEKKEFEQVLENMTSRGELIRLSPQVIWGKDVFAEATGKLKEHFEQKGEIALAECRDILGTSRKYALAFLEFLDGRQITRKQGDSRILINSFDSLIHGGNRVTGVPRGLQNR